MPEFLNKKFCFSVENKKLNTEPVYILKNKIWHYINRLCLVFIYFILISALTLFNPFLMSPAEAISPFEIDNLMGAPAPDFVLQDINRKPVSLSSLKGRIIILNFWAVWCPTCKREFPSLNKLSLMYEGRNVAILSVALGRPSAVMDYVRNKHFNFKMLIDADMDVSTSLYKIFMVPTAFIIDSRGVIVKRYFGQQNWIDEKIIRELDMLLNDIRKPSG